MPIDPNIALSIKPPQPIDLNAYRMQNVQLQSMRDSQALNAQTLKNSELQGQREQLGLDQEKRVAEGTQAYQNAMKKNTSYDPDKGLTVNHEGVQSDLIGAGFPELASSHKKNQTDLERQQRQDELANLDLHIKKIGQFSNMAQTVLSADPRDRAARYQLVRQQAVDEGLLDPDTMKHVPEQYDPNSTDAMLQQFVAESSTAKDQLGMASTKIKEQQEKETHDADMAIKNADLNKKNIDNESQILGSAVDQDSWNSALSKLDPKRQVLYPAIFSDKAREQAAMQGLTEKERDAIKSKTEEELAMDVANGGDKGKTAKAALDYLKKYKIEIETAKIHAQNDFSGSGLVGSPISQLAPGQRDEALLLSIPANLQTAVRNLIDYKGIAPTARSLTTPYIQNLLGLASRVDPSFDITQYPIRQALKIDFTSGDTSKNLKSLNTAVGHLGELSKAAKALDNYSFQSANTGKNTISEKLGSSKVTNFDTERDAVANELTKAFRGSDGAEADIQSWKAKINSSQSPEQLNDGINTVIRLMGSRMSSISEQYKKGMGKPKDFYFLDPSARKILSDMGADVESMDPRLGGSQASAQQAPAGKVMTEDLIKAGMAANKGMTRQQIIDGLKKDHSYAGIDK